jgi:hypothetical protein
MPQTIALQRGTTTVTTDSSSVVTLFTQSGGTATRVIVNNLGVYFTTSPNSGNVSIMLLISQSGGQDMVIGQIISPDRTRSYQFLAGSSTNNSFAGVGLSQFNSSNNNVVPNTPIIRSNGSNGVASTGSASIGVVYSSLQGTQLAVLNSNFYMGPNDSIKMKMFAQYQSGKSVLSTTGNISYSFTTITES